jgi:hypothetical protein
MSGNPTYQEWTKEISGGFGGEQNCLLVVFNQGLSLTACTSTIGPCRDEFPNWVKE